MQTKQQQSANNPKVSVLMPAYNAQEFIAEAIESILGQTFADFEFIIVDDGSTDNTWQIIQKYAKQDKRVVPLQNEVNSKICITLNNGLTIARGKYTARMDADDWTYPDRLQKQVDFLDAHSNVVIIGGSMEVCDIQLNPTNKRTYNKTDKEIRKKIFRYSPFCHASTMFKTVEMQKIGGYNPELYDVEDYDMYFRLGKHGTFANLPDTTYKMRVNTDSVSHTRARRQEQMTLYVRVKAVMEYGYKMTFGDKFYLFVQFMSMYMIPQRFKFWLFNKLRG